MREVAFSIGAVQKSGSGRLLIDLPISIKLPVGILSSSLRILSFLIVDLSGYSWANYLQFS